MTIARREQTRTASKIDITKTKQLKNSRHLYKVQIISYTDQKFTAFAIVSKENLSVFYTSPS